MKLEVVITRGKNNRYEANLQNPKQVAFGLFGEGYSVDETIEDFKVSVEEMKELHAEENKPFPEQLDFKFIYDTASFLEYYGEKLSLAGLGRITGINRKQLSHYLTGHSRPSVKTIQKIEKSLNDFGRELSQVSFV